MTHREGDTARVDGAPGEIEELFRTAFDYAPVGMTLTSLDGVFLRVNHALSVMFGLPIEELAGMRVSDLTHPDDRAADTDAMQRMVRGETANFRTEKRYQHVDDHWVWASLSASIVHDAQRALRYFISQMEDITQQREAELMRRALSSMSSGVSLIDVRDPNQTLVYVNAALERLTGYSAAELLGRNWKVSERPETELTIAARLDDAVERGEELCVPVRHHRRDGTACWSESLMTPVYAEDGAITHYMSVQKDVTEKTEAGHRAAHMALPRPAHGVTEPRAVTGARDPGACARRAQGHRRGPAVPRPQSVQASQRPDGHDIGDRLLEDVARRWRSTARHGDVLARYGGDEFVLLMMDVPPESARAIAASAAERYTDALKAPFDAYGTPGRMVEIGVSVGIALYPEDARTPAELFLAADADMYAGKCRAQPSGRRSSPGS